MSTVKEVILGGFAYSFPDATVNILLEERGLQQDAVRDVNDQDQTKAMDLTKVDLIDFLILSWKSVKELDFQFTQQDADALLAVRRRILWKWGIVDEPAESSFVDISNTH
ncbi:hypothetical protein [Sphingobacterium kyonggiense]